MQEWVHVSWHIDGMSYDRYMLLTMKERFALHNAVNDKIDLSNEAPDIPTRPKEWRK
jgi:hypothetical protein